MIVRQGAPHLRPTRDGFFGQGKSRRASTMSKKVIVVVDDDESWSKAVRSLLSNEGYDVKVANDGASGLDLFERIRPALVIVDVHLPRVNGFALLRQLRLSNREARVVMVSADDQSSLVGQALAEGAATFLRKPIPDDLLLRAVRRYLVS